MLRRRSFSDINLEEFMALSDMCAGTFNLYQKVGGGEQKLPAAACRKTSFCLRSRHLKSVFCLSLKVTASTWPRQKTLLSQQVCELSASPTVSVRSWDVSAEKSPRDFFDGLRRKAKASRRFLFLPCRPYSHFIIGIANADDFQKHRREYRCAAQYHGNSRSYKDYRQKCRRVGQDKSVKMRIYL